MPINQNAPDPAYLKHSAPQRANSPAQLLPLGALMLAASMSSWAQEAGTTLAPVIVKDNHDRAAQTYQSGLTSTARTPAAAKDVPQSLTVVNEKLMHDQGKDTFKEALKNVPGITYEAGEGGRIGDNIRLRGFTVAGDIYLDGIRDIAQYNRDTFNYDRIEVLRGSASMLFGRGSTGGVVNQVSKLPRLRTESELNLTGGNGNYLRATGDFNVQTGEHAALRIGAMHTDWDGRAGKASTHRRGLAADYRIGIGTSDEFLFSLYHLDYKDRPDLGGRWLEGRPAPFPKNKWYGADSDYQKDSADMVTLSHLHRWEDGSTVRTTLRDGKFDRDLWATQIGALSATQANFGPNTVVPRGTLTRAGEEHHTFLQSEFITRKQWLGRDHQWLLGVDLARERSARDGYTNIPRRSPTTVELADNSAIADTRVRNRLTQFKSTALGIYAQDTISLTADWKLVAGLRWDRLAGSFDRSGNPAPNNTPLARSDSVWSKRIGILYQPTPEASYYASYGTSFNTSGDLYQFDPSSANTPPESSRNVEVGAKWELYEGDLSVRTALARTDKYNERNTDVDQASGAFLLSGRRHTDSLEFEVSGRITPRWDVFSGLVFMHGVIDKAGSAANAQATVGRNPGLTPKRQANLWTTYRLTEQWRIGGGVTYVSENGPASGNPVALANRAPAYTKWDAMVEYVHSRSQSVLLNIDNLTNKLYYSSLYQNWPSIAPLRTVRVTWTARF